MTTQPLERTVPASPVAGTAVEFVNVTRNFGNMSALDGLNLKVAGGEFLALLGPSGCGKTTALRLLAGFDRPTSGAIVVGGSDISRTPANKRDMGMVFQSYSLFPTMSARENVAFGLKIRQQPTAGRGRRAMELLELVGLSAHAAKYPHQLSGGQQQRVALARALAIQPRVLLLDEPLSALDAKVREQLRGEIRRIQLELGVTTVFVTHDQEEALSLADRVGVMHAGKLEQCASPAVIYDRPATAFVAQFVGTMNRIPAIGEHAGKVKTRSQVLDVVGEPPAVGAAVTVLVRPEAVGVAADNDGDAVVLVATFRGPTTRLLLRAGDGTEIMADIASQRGAELPVGQRASVTLPPVPVLLSTTS
jgi:putative spermidine/putrescine transport system ATP-binding protein